MYDTDTEVCVYVFIFMVVCIGKFVIMKAVTDNYFREIVYILAFSI